MTNLDNKTLELVGSFLTQCHPCASCSNAVLTIDAFGEHNEDSEVCRECCCFIEKPGLFYNYETNLERIKTVLMEFEWASSE